MSAYILVLKIKTDLNSFIRNYNQNINITTTTATAVCT